jgi:hypothetical protein
MKSQHERDRFQAEYKLGKTIRPANWGSLTELPRDGLSYRAARAMRHWFKSRPDGARLKRELGS